MYPVWYPLKCLDYTKKGTNMAPDNDSHHIHISQLGMLNISMHIYPVPVHMGNSTGIPRANVTKTY